MTGDAGNNLFRGGGGVDGLDGGGGAGDVIDFSDKTVAVVLALAGSEAVFASVGGADEDIFRNFEGVRGGAAADRLTGDAQANTLLGQSGDDVLRGGGGADVIDGEADFDFVDYRDKSAVEGVTLTLNGSTATAVLVAGRAEDTIRNIEHVYGGQGADRLTGDAQGNVFYAGRGNDVLRGGAGRDYLSGDAGMDLADYSEKLVSVVVALAGAAAAVVRVGGVAEDYVRGIELIYGGAVGDTLTGDGLANLFRGGGGADVIDGGAGVDSVDFRDKTAGVSLTLNGATFATATVGGAVEDRVRNVEGVYGGSGADALIGDGLANQLLGGAGDDSLRGLLGADQLTGGAGADRFFYNTVAESTAAATGRDTILDFSRAQADRIYLNLIDANTMLAGDQAFALGALAAGQAGRLSSPPTAPVNGSCKVTSTETAPPISRSWPFRRLRR